ncbi:S41 family peptidase [Desulfoscipio sp. XC116]|uniref:S41 family peptidase n=1 Tax=Desulfoscipio sp. XC116 TaxID=3144975 RepID=UPI00325AF15C
MNRRILILVCVLLVVFGWFKPAQAADDLESDAALVLELMDLMHEYHLNNPDADTLTNGAIQGLLDSLEDPYADYFSADTLKDYIDSLNGYLEGIGIEILAGEQYPCVYSVIPGTPAAKSGIMAGDIIVAVDGKSTVGWTLADVVEKIKGPSGSVVVLTIQRGEDDSLDVDLKRADIHLPSVHQEMLAGQTGYINLTFFGSDTGREFNKAVRDLKAAGMTSLIIDLRNNGGGYAQEAVDIIGDFVAKDTLAVSTVDRQGNREEVRTWDKPVADSLPVVVIVNELSASASELLAGALQDYKIASLVGTATFGKGVVQTIIPLSSGGALKMTVFKYLTPAGQDIDSVGLTPDHYVFTWELQKEVAWQTLHPEHMPRLTFDLATGRTTLNDRVLEINIKARIKDGAYMLPLRPVLEAMFYQVFWQDGVIKVFAGQKEVWRANLPKGGTGGQSDIIVQDGVSYLSENILRQLNIDISKEESKITLTRSMQ